MPLPTPPEPIIITATEIRIVDRVYPIPPGCRAEFQGWQIQWRDANPVLHWLFYHNILLFWGKRRHARGIGHFVIVREGRLWFPPLT